LTQPVSFWQLRVGHILDAQDYLENWNLAIVVDTDSPPTPDSKGLNVKRKIHFLPFKNSKRDEIFSANESQQKIAPAFTHTEK